VDIPAPVLAKRAAVLSRISAELVYGQLSDTGIDGTIINGGKKMKWDWKNILYLLVGVAAVIDLLYILNISLGLPAIVKVIGNWLLIAGGLLWGMKAILGREL